MSREQNTVYEGRAIKVRRYSITFFFLLVIAVLTVASFCKKDRSFSENENRVLQQKPVFSAESLFDGTYTSESEAYVTDQFVLRDQWIAVKVYAEKLLQKKEINGVYFASDHYLIQQHKADDVDQTQVQKNIDRLSEFVSRYGDTLNVQALIVPTASYVLADRLPAYAPEYDQDNLLAKIKQATGEDHFIDVSESLLAHKNEYIYYRTDHHWTSLGAYYAYCKSAEALGFTPYEKQDFSIVSATNEFLGTTYSKVNCDAVADTIDLYYLKSNQGYSVSIDQGDKTIDGLFDLTKLKDKDKYPVFLGGNNSYVEITGGKKNGKTLLVIKDSFAHTFVPFLANHYEKIIMIDYRYYNQSTEQLLKDQNVTDVLLLYNTMNFAEDKNLLKLLK